MATPPETPVPIVLIGASAGGVSALLSLAAQLPATLKAAILVVLHIDSMDGGLPALLNYRGRVRASYASEGETIVAGRIYIAPPNRHLIVDADVMRLVQGPKENFSRPAIDPLFRSAALTRRGPLIGVILTGMLDDGAVGLRLVRQSGGLALAQDPDDAECPSMPRAALLAVPDAETFRLESLAELLVERIGGLMATSSNGIPSAAAEEFSLFLGREDAIEVLPRIADPSTFTCPDCGGTLWKLHDERPSRFRCHTGHSFTLRSLEHAHALISNMSMWITLRTLNEKRELLKELAKQYGEQDGNVGAAASDLAESVERAALHLRKLLETLPGSLTSVIAPDEP